MEEQERKLDQFLNQKYDVCGMVMRVVDILFIVCLFAFTFSIRWQLMPIGSGDYYGCLAVWMDAIREGGGFASLATEISNYTPPYMYIMTLLSYISNDDLYALKLVSVLFDYLSAVAVCRILYHMTGNLQKSILGMAVLLLSPTVILDGAYWGQCDMIYACFLLYSYLYFLKGKAEKSAVFFAFSFIFKLQSLFLLPFFIIMWLKKQTIQLRYYLWVPVIYFVSVLPAWIAGRDLLDLLTIYMDQSGYYPQGSLNYPNIYLLFDETISVIHHAEEVSAAGTFAAIMILGCIAYFVYTRTFRMTQDLMITLALFTVAITVYALPHMHDRYGIMVDLLSVVYGVYRIRRLPVTCGFMLASVLSFMPFLINVEIVPLRVVAIFQLALITVVGYDLARQIREQTITPESSPSAT